MEITKFVGSIALGINVNGHYAHGHLSDESELVDIEKREKIDAKKLLDNIIPKDVPIITLTIQRRLLLKMLYEMELEDSFIYLDIYGVNKPMVFRGAETFFVTMPAVTDIGYMPLNIRKAAGI